MMGGMGRTFDGGYAEYTCVPVAQVIPFRSEPADWATLGAVPEMLQTAYGSLTVGLDLQPGQTLLIRGGTSSVGMAAAVLAKHRGLTVLATTRSQAGSTRCGRSASTTRRRRRRGRGARPRARARRRRRGARARRHADAARHACAPRASTASPASRDAQQRVDGARLLPDRLPAHRRAPDRLRRRRDRPAAAVLQTFLDDVAAGRATVPIARPTRSTRSRPPTPTWSTTAPRASWWCRPGAEASAYLYQPGRDRRSDDWPHGLAAAAVDRDVPDGHGAPDVV